MRLIYCFFLIILNLSCSEKKIHDDPYNTENIAENIEKNNNSETMQESFDCNEFEPPSIIPNDEYKVSENPEDIVFLKSDRQPEANILIPPVMIENGIPFELISNTFDNVEQGSDVHLSLGPLFVDLAGIITRDRLGDSGLRMIEIDLEGARDNLLLFVFSDGRLKGIINSSKLPDKFLFYYSGYLGYLAGYRTLWKLDGCPRYGRGGSHN